MDDWLKISIMVNAQEYIEKNFPKDISEIVVINADDRKPTNLVGEKGLEGHLDLSEYPNLTKVDIGHNSHLKSLKLGISTKITSISIYETSITDFSFLLNTPNLEHLCLPYIDRPKILRDYQVGQVVRDVNQSWENKEQLQWLSSLLFPSQPYNFNQFEQEITRFKHQELAPQVREEKAKFEQLITDAKTKAGNSEKIVDLLLETQKQLIKNNDQLIQGQLIAYQKILESNLTKQEIQTILTKQTKLSQLEKHLESLKQNQEQVAYIQQNSPPKK